MCLRTHLYHLDPEDNPVTTTLAGFIKSTWNLAVTPRCRPLLDTALPLGCSPAKENHDYYCDTQLYENYLDICKSLNNYTNINFL